MKEEIRKSFLEAAVVLKAFTENEENLTLIVKPGNLMIESLRNEGTIISCGNGGSMCDAMHFGVELTGRFSAASRFPQYLQSAMFDAAKASPRSFKRACAPARMFFTN